jgi:EAL and modified HD-GYP domain-containing signal transduction protein
LVDLRRSSVPGLAPGIALAWGLTDPAAFADIIARGFSGACGWFFLRGMPQADQQRAAPTFGIVLQLIQKLQHDADIAEIEELLKRDVALSYRLLRYINSAGMGLMCEVTSFRHAVQILGYRNLLKWLSLLLLHTSQHPSQQALAQTAIVRGRFMEEIGKGLFPVEVTEQLFLCGVFSVIDVLLGVSMTEVLQHIAVSQAVREALTRGQGEFAPFLELARACESPDAALLRHHAEKLGLASLSLNRAHLTALEYADRLNA